jgi:long-chain acyl-CoA synthetase
VNLAVLLARAARTFGDRPALSVGASVWADYRRLAGRVAALAGGLTGGLGLRPGDRLALGMSNAPEFMEALLAAWHAGLVAVPMNAKLHRREFAHILDDAGARACIVTPDLADTVGPLADELEGLERLVTAGDGEYGRLLAAEPVPMRDAAPTDPAWLFYTSGTTGRPKGAVLSHRNLLAMTLNYLVDVDPVAPTDAIVHAAPMSHGSGLYGLPHLAMAANQIVPESHGFDPAEIVGLLETYRGVAFFFAPTMVVRLLDSPALRDAGDLLGLKTLVYGGGPMYLEDCLRALDRLGPRLVQIYGQGEAPMTITGVTRAMHAEPGHPRFRERLASVGIARTGVEVRVVDADDRELPPGETGEVVCRGDVVMAGYWRNPEATAAALRGGWLHTGDVGRFDGDGFLTLLDRSKDLIISGGANVYPREVEEVLLRHPALLEASVVGRPHPEWGEEVVAFVVARPGQMVSEAELDRLCLDHIARFKRPRAYRFVDALPKNNYGKVLKTELRGWLKGP